MAEEKKKRWRPSLGEYRALQAELETTKAELEKFKTSGVVPKADYDVLLKERNIAIDENNKFIADNAELHASLKAEVAKVISLENDNSRLYEENKRLKGRTLWQRIINKK